MRAVSVSPTAGLQRTAVTVYGEGEVSPVGVTLRMILHEGITPGILVHAMRNHDELMFDLARMRNHGDTKFWFNG